MTATRVRAWSRCEWKGMPGWAGAITSPTAESLLTLSQSTVTPPDRTSRTMSGPTGSTS